MSVDPIVHSGEWAAHRMFFRMLNVTINIDVYVQCGFGIWDWDWNIDVNIDVDVDVQWGLKKFFQLLVGHAHVRPCICTGDHARGVF